MVATYAQSPVDVFLWSVGGHEVFTYETDVGERYGEVPKPFVDPIGNQTARNFEALIQSCGGPLSALVDLCHEADMDFIPSVRMNEHYDVDPSVPEYGRFRRDHPEWLIGRPDEVFAEGKMEWGVRTGLNFAFPQVRSYMTDQISELFEQFDVDGVELDFMRHPTFFRIEEGYANRHLMTDLLSTVRRRMRKAGESRGKRLDLTVRVPPTLPDAARIGLDVEQWIADDLIDIVIAGGGFIPFSMPLEQFVAAAKGSNCQVYGGIEHLRPALDDDVVRAIAAKFWAAGADGIHLFNYFGKSAEWNRHVLNQIADPSRLDRLDKRYHMDHTDRLMPRDLHDFPFRHAVPAVQLPVMLTYTLRGRGAMLTLSVADDVRQAKSEGALDTCELRLSMDNYTAEDELEIWLNGQVLSPSLCRRSFGGWRRLEWTQFPDRTAEVNHLGGTLDYDLSDSFLQPGENTFEIRLVKRTVQQAMPLVLRDLQLHIRYQSA